MNTSDFHAWPDGQNRQSPAKEAYLAIVTCRNTEKENPNIIRYLVGFSLRSRDARTDPDARRFYRCCANRYRQYLRATERNTQ